MRASRRQWLLASVAAFTLPALHAQVKVDLINEVGAKGPCVGLGLGMAIVHKCVSRAEKEGFLRVSDVGESGLIIGTTGPDDGVVTKVDSGSAAAKAGVQQGDRVISIEGQSAKWTPEMSIAKQTFGEQGKDFQLTVRVEDGGPEKRVTIVRGQAQMPANAPKGSMLLPLMPLIDWRGHFVPCTATGPMMAAVDALCAKMYAPYGYIRAKEAGSTGFTVKAGQNGTAIVDTVTAGSGAAAAGLAKGQIITAVDDKPLTGSNGELASQALFGKAGDTRNMTLERNGQQKAVSFVLQEK